MSLFLDLAHFRGQKSVKKKVHFLRDLKTQKYGKLISQKLVKILGSQGMPWCFHEKFKMNAVVGSGGGVGGETPTVGKQQIVQGGKRKAL